MRIRVAASVLAVAAPLAAAVPAAPAARAVVADGAVARPVHARASHGVVVSVLTRGLSHPWDVRSIGHDRLLITQRDPARLTVLKKGHTRNVRFPSDRIWTSGETGLMGLAIDPAYASNHRFYTCSGWNVGNGRHDVRVNAWRMDPNATRATLIKPLVTGFPTSSGRHGGCRLLIARDGSMYVGTGDAATGTNPENRSSLGGKTLRLDRMTGRPWKTNPFIHSSNAKRRYVQTFGHRNVQGVTQRSDGSVWSVEQGTDRDDEVNKLVNGGDYGYNPVPGYNESVPMTDQGLPGKQYAARWRSGNPTIATSGGSFVYGKQWGGLNGTLAVAALKGERIVFLHFDKAGKLTGTTTPSALRRYGRLRTVVQLGNGNLLVPTDGDNGNDALLLVRHR